MKTPCFLNEMKRYKIPILKTHVSSSEIISMKEHIYETLNLNTYDTFKDKLKEFISTQKNIRTSSYQLPETIKNEIWGAWQFSFNAFGYTR